MLYFIEHKAVKMRK